MTKRNVVKMSTNMVEKDKYTLTRYCGKSNKMRLQIAIEDNTTRMCLGFLTLSMDELDEFIADLMYSYKELKCEN